MAVWVKLGLSFGAVFGFGVNAFGQEPPANVSPLELPSGGVVTTGQAQIAPAGNGVLTIQQSSQSAIINWDAL